MLHIVSIGHRAAFVPHLRQCGLLEFFDEQRIWGQDCEELRREGFIKGRLIAKMMASSGWTHADVLFVDDSKDHIEKASDVCRTLLVNKGAHPPIGALCPTPRHTISLQHDVPECARAPVRHFSRWQRSTAACRTANLQPSSLPLRFRPKQGRRREQ